MKCKPHSQFHQSARSPFALVLFVFAAALATCALLGMAGSIGRAMGWIAEASKGTLHYSQAGFDARFFGAATASALLGVLAAILAVIGCFLRPPTSS